MWNNVMTNLRRGQQLLTPGRGIPPNRQRPFVITGMGTTHIDIEIGKAQTPNRLPRAMFDAVDAYFRNNPSGHLRIAAEHAVIPTEDSVDEVARAAVHFPRAIGNYVAAILEAANCVRYFMNGDQKCIRI
ncbi:MAG: hypothetical protein A4E69_00026 [Syntrophus sp. PtaB.Bin138]|nr:MAG: hypothetical protein A4E69_00026 [Syntrophus sp. PtaB.Bin138]